MEKKQKTDFESRLKELEGIVAALEAKDITLEKGIELFERGVGVTRECLAALNESKGKLTIVKKELDKLIEEDYHV